MNDGTPMICDDLIKNKIKPFLDDLLTEAEYRAYIDHLNACERCNTYARSFSSLSNHIWKLGKVRPPEDLGSTILYKMDHPDEGPPAPAFLSLAKSLAVGTVLVLITVSVFLGITYWKGRTKAEGKKTVNAPAARAEAVKAIRYASVPGDGEDQFTPELPPREIAAPEMAVFEKKEVPQASPEEIGGPEEDALMVEATSAPEGEAAQVPAPVVPLHWHIQYPAETGDTKVETGQRNIQQQIDLVNKEIITIEANMTSLEKEKEYNRLKLGERYTLELKENKLAQERQTELAIQEWAKEKKQQQAVLVTLEEEKRRLDAQRQQKLKSELQRQDTHWTKVLNIFAVLGMIPDYKDSHLLVVRIGRDRLKYVRDQIAFTARGTYVLRDFDSGAAEADLARGDYLISMYFPGGGTPALHWHLDAAQPGLVSDLSEIIQAKSVSVDYSSDKLIVFSVPEENVGDLRAQVKSRAVRFAEFGRDTLHDSLSAGMGRGTVKISICFANK